MWDSKLSCSKNLEIKFGCWFNKIYLAWIKQNSKIKVSGYISEFKLVLRYENSNTDGGKSHSDVSEKAIEVYVMF